MDYFGEFKVICKNIIAGKIVKVFNAATTTQTINDFERELNDVSTKIETNLKLQRDILLEMASKDNYLEIVKLNTDISNYIRYVIREFRYSQKENSGLY